MAYTKINWDELNTPLSAANLNKMETQYDEAITHAGAGRADSNLALCVEVVGVFPAHAAGKLIFHSGEDKGYYSNGTNWIPAFVKAEELS